MKSEIQRMLEEENRDKKRIGSNIYKRTGTRGYTGAIRSPHDLLKGKAKREYEGNSKVMTSNMYDKILPKSEFDKLEPHIQRNMLSYWYLTHGTLKIRSGMQIGAKTLYNLLEKLGIERKGKTGRKPRTSKKKKVGAGVAIPKETIETLDISSMYPTIITPEPVVNNWGLSINYNGSYESNDIQKILQKLDLLLQDENKTFEISISLKEV